MWILVILAVIIAIVTVKSINEKKYRELETEVLKKLGFSNWNVVSYYDEYVTVKSRQSLEKYDDEKQDIILRILWHSYIDAFLKNLYNGKLLNIDE